MATEYRLSYTAEEIDSRLGKVIKLTEDTERLTADTERLATDVQKKVEVVELTTAEFNALNEAGNIDDKTFYSLTDVDEEVKIELDTTLTVEGQAADAKAVGDALAEKISYIPQTLTEDQRLQARTNIGIIEASDIEAVELLAELEIATPVADGDAIYTDEQNNILII